MSYSHLRVIFTSSHQTCERDFSDIQSLCLVVPSTKPQVFRIWIETCSKNMLPNTGAKWWFTMFESEKSSKPSCQTWSKLQQKKNGTSGSQMLNTGALNLKPSKKNTVNLWFMTSNPKLGRFFFSHPTNIDNIAKAKATSSGHSLLLSPTKKVVV